MYGWHGTALVVDLGTGAAVRRKLSPELLSETLGGRGLGARLLWSRHRADPFDPRNPIILAAGPLAGTPAPTSARVQVVTRSPLTGTITDGSAGGRFAVRLKGAGIDALVITGRAPKPVVLRVTPEGGAIEPAERLWGLDTTETCRRLAEAGSVASIGPAGENRVLFAALVFGKKNVAGRGGIGAVFGAKNLKAVTVSGDLPTSVADPAGLRIARDDVIRLFRASPTIMGEFGLQAWGTPTLVDLMANRRMAPAANFRETVFEGFRSYDAAALRTAHRPKRDGCFACPIQCKKARPDGRPLPEYETLSHFGGLLLNRRLETIIKANDTCNRLGLDTISMAATLAAYGEARGAFPAEDEIVDLVEKTAFRKGIGDSLAQGARRLMDAMGRPELAMTVKSLELPAYDPRGAYGMALAYGTSNRGGDHLRAYPVGHEILRKPVGTDRFTMSGKARIIALNEDQNAVADSLIACKFAFFGASLEEYAAALSAVTGRDYASQGLLARGRETVVLERRINWDIGFRMADDFLPQRFYQSAGSSGDGIRIPPLDENRYREELVRYYRIRGLGDDGAPADGPVPEPVTLD